ncbi:helix-turn-helix domain-containing protein [Cerasicoccus fimbriatus]|uniref:helix-turn-helix domain-containing protein n=1 Tax=Cerasicoccus fimbriatus TaxID=3014554 RepID=UPI0022B57081|nr:AraC family transcriptional regulator [Cerasicoccus sp. TK19100]
MPELYRISWASRETRNSRRYHYDNTSRGGPPIYVVQRTVSGCGFIERDGVRSLTPQNTAMLFWHGDQSNYGYAEESNGPYVLDFMAITGPQCEAIFHKVNELSDSIMPMPKQSEPTRLFYELSRRFNEHTFQDPYHESMLVYELLISLLREATRIPAERDPITYAAEYIQRRYHQPITIDEVAQAAGVSREHLTRQLTRRLGQSPGKRLQELRMQAGKDLVCHTTAPIEAIGPHCGYLDPDAFARAFARRFKMSPGKYRQRYQENSGAAGSRS